MPSGAAAGRASLALALILFKLAAADLEESSSAKPECVLVQGSDRNDINAGAAMASASAGGVPPKEALTSCKHRVAQGHAVRIVSTFRVLSAQQNQRVQLR